MNNFNTSERNIQIVLDLLKKHGIKRVIASPGSTDIAIVASMQHDDYYEMYSCIDERSACYMATGMCAETKEPVVIICTGATSSRNYMPGLTEAYYRHLPILAITCCRSNANVGHYVNQVTDRSDPPRDVVNFSTYVQTVRSTEDEWDCTVKVNKAILGLRFNGGGPCHINLETQYEKDFSVKNIPPVRMIKRYTIYDDLPDIQGKKIGIFVGNFPSWEDELTKSVDEFCEKYDALVFYDQTSNYKGKYGVLYPLIAAQLSHKAKGLDIDLMIHIGYVSATVCKGKTMWRVNEDGEIRDPFRKVTAVFQMREKLFFDSYNKKLNTQKQELTLYNKYTDEYNNLIKAIPEIPFSNIWVAQTLAPKIPEGSIMHFGICNSLRSWNNFTIGKTIQSYSNTGGFGIDGGISSLVGASLMRPNKLCFGVFGDLLFYYDMNSLGSRHITSNLRIIIINNGLGQEFKNYESFGALFGEEANEFIAAEGHFGANERPVIKNYVESLGFKYLTAKSKEEFLKVYLEFIDPTIGTQPIVFEIFTESKKESEAQEMMTMIDEKSKQIRTSNRMTGGVRSAVKKFVKKLLNE